jgi:hypothetical protein
VRWLTRLGLFVAAAAIVVAVVVDAAPFIAKNDKNNIICYEV